jgi:hypothetical protein
MTATRSTPEFRFTVAGLAVLLAAVVWSLLAPRVSALSDAIEAVRAGRTDKIEIDAATVGDEDLALISDLNGLRVLALPNGRFTDAGIKHLAGLTRLTALNLPAVGLTDEGVETVARLSGLRQLNLHQTELTDAGLERLTGLADLELLRLGGRKITDSGVSHLAKLPNLRFLHLLDVSITDAGLEPIRAMRRLESFYLSGGQTTDAGLSALHKARPDLHFHFFGEHLADDPQRGHHEH